MAIHFHPVSQPPEKAQVFHGVSLVAIPTKTASKAAADFAALFTSSARQPSNITVSSPATSSASAPAGTTPSAASSATPPSSASVTAPTASANGSTSVSVTPPSSSIPVTPVNASPGDGPAGPLFGPTPWLADPTGSGPGPTTHYSQFYFATPQTAQTVANMLGGTVVAATEMISASGTPFTQNQPNLMVQLPNGGMVNPGLVATFFTHSWPTSFINVQIANEVAGAAPPNATT